MAIRGKLPRIPEAPAEPLNKWPSAMTGAFPVPVAEGVTPESPEPSPPTGPDGCGIPLALADRAGAGGESQPPSGPPAP